MFPEPRSSKASTDRDRPTCAGFVPLDQLLATAACDPASLDPALVRATILAEHQKLRVLLTRLEAGATALLACATHKASARHALRQLALQLCDEMEAHVAFENQLLLPVIERVDAWGQARAHKLSQEHAQQLQLLQAYAGMLTNDEDTPQALSITVWSLVETIREDMSDEEAEVLNPDVLSDHLMECSETG
jgi:iron-sulfur cluster repair protein YtfE (RIC family)